MLLYFVTNHRPGFGFHGRRHGILEVNNDCIGRGANGFIDPIRPIAGYE
jgi:hypothetical protein